MIPSSSVISLYECTITSKWLYFVFKNSMLNLAFLTLNFLSFPFIKSLMIKLVFVNSHISYNVSSVYDLAYLSKFLINLLYTVFLSLQLELLKNFKKPS